MDGLGSLRQMINSAGVPQYLTSYDPFGSPFEAYNAVANPSIGFTGQMTDDNGLQYLRARYYDPSVGQFLSQDPVMGVVGGSYGEVEGMRIVERYFRRGGWVRDDLHFRRRGGICSRLNLTTHLRG